MAEYWFRQKTHGYGGYPINWKGWAATFGFGIGVTALALVTFLTAGPEGPSTLRIVLWFVAEAVFVAALLWICRARTEGGWRWRWGEDDGS